MAKKSINKEIGKAFDDANANAGNYGANDEYSHENYMFNAPIAISHLKKYGAELEKILKESEGELDLSGYNDLTDAQRNRLLGSGVRRLGFIVKTHELALENPMFAPGFLDMQKFADLLVEITESRNIVVNLEQLARIYNDILLIAGNDAFRLALMYYNSVRDASRRGVPGAKAVFRRLESFFRRGRTEDVEEAAPTDKKTIKKAKKLLKGKADGTIIIEGHAKHTTAAEHKVIDIEDKPAGTFSETLKGTVCGGCGTSNPETAKFCCGCGKALK